MADKGHYYYYWVGFIFSESLSRGRDENGGGVRNGVEVVWGHTKGGVTKGGRHLLLSEPLPFETLAGFNILSLSELKKQNKNRFSRVVLRLLKKDIVTEKKSQLWHMLKNANEGIVKQFFS